MSGEDAMTGKEDFAASLMDDMDPRLLELIQNRVNSFIKWDLVRFFHDNPQTTDTADSIARYTGRDVRTVEPELIQLAQDGVLDMEDLSGMRVYTLTQEQTVRELVASFIQACDDRQFRVKAIYHVIRSLR
jgi:predicted transcriptional regulator